MAGDVHRTKHQIEQDRQIIAELYLKQWRQADIARELGISQATVSRDLLAIQKRWRESSIRDMDELKQQELAKIDALEREYWLAWEASKEDAETATQKQSERGKEVSLQKKGQTGDPRYLAGVERCMEMRAKILGIHAPERIEHLGRLETIVNADAFARAVQQRLGPAAVERPALPDAPDDGNLPPD